MSEGKRESYYEGGLLVREIELEVEKVKITRISNASVLVDPGEGWARFQIFWDGNGIVIEPTMKNGVGYGKTMSREDEKRLKLNENT